MSEDNISRRNFLAGLATTGAAATLVEAQTPGNSSNPVVGANHSVVESKPGEGIIKIVCAERLSPAEVVTPEPLPPENPLWDCPNLVITPHNSGVAPMRQVRLVALVAENVRRYSNGLPLLNVVDKARGY